MITTSTKLRTLKLGAQAIEAPSDLQQNPIAQSSDISSFVEKQSTLSGYGIEDAKIEGDYVVLGDKSLRMVNGFAVKSFSDREKMMQALQSESSAGMSSFQNTVLAISDDVSYYISELSVARDVGTGEIISTDCKLTHLTNDKLYSIKEDMMLSANPSIGRMEISFEAGKWWYAADTGIKFEKLTGSEPDGMRSAIYSQSEKCYYIGTTQGLYRTYNDDMTGCERILSNQLVCNASDPNLSSPSYRAHIPCVREIGDHKYVMYITGATGYSHSRIATFNSKEMTCFVNADSGEGWLLNDTLISSNGLSSTIAVTNASAGQGILRNYTVDLSNLSSITTYLSRGIDAVAGTALQSQAAQYVQRLNGKCFLSRHSSDSSSGGSSKGVIYFDDSNLGNADIPCYEVNELSSSRIYQLRVNSSKVYVCCGLSSQDTSDHLGLYELSIDDGNVTCQQLKDDPFLSAYQNCKDIYYSAKTKKWIFALDQMIYTSDQDENGKWTELVQTGFSLGDESYPKFVEMENFIVANELHSDSAATGGKHSNVIVTSTNGNQKVATTADIKIKKVTIDGNPAVEDEHGFLNIPVASAVKQVIQVVDALPASPDENVIYFIKKRS